MKTLYCFLSIFFCFSTTLFAQKNESDRKRNQPVVPFKIIGNIYYVGASDVTSFLITSPEGHILIDGGYKETAAQIAANIVTLGFNPQDIKIMLINHAHHDHCGGLAELKKLTHATLYASAPDKPVLESGGRKDFHFGGKEPIFPAVKVDVVLKDQQEIRLGNTILKTHFTHGHTMGATSWTMNVTENGELYPVVFSSSVSSLDYPLVNNKKYPNIVADFRKTYTTLASLKPAIFLGAHGEFFDLTEKIALLKKGTQPNPFIDPEGYKEFVANAREAFEERLAAAKSGKK